MNVIIYYNKTQNNDNDEFIQNCTHVIFKTRSKEVGPLDIPSILYLTKKNV